MEQVALTASQRACMAELDACASSAAVVAVMQRHIADAVVQSASVPAHLPVLP
jgi:hypothetical protein